MKLKPLPKRLPVILAGFLFCLSCMKTIPPSPGSSGNNGNGTGNDSTNSNLPPAITPIGTPVGTPVTQTIGPSGGLVVSDDGLLLLNIPAGALSTNTDITIQPVTNETPYGIGNSYHLMPDGTKFSKPAMLTFVYTDEDVNGCHPYSLFIAYQDSLNEWKADVKNRFVDTISKTMSLEIKHFSIWSMGSSFRLASTKRKLFAGESAELTLQIYHPSKTTPGQSGDELPSLPKTTIADPKKVNEWAVNGTPGGSEEDGLIADESNIPTAGGSASKAIYNAPGTIEEEREVTVSVSYEDAVAFYNNGAQVFQINKYVSLTQLRLEPAKFTYKLQITLLEVDELQSKYKDTADILLTVDNDIVIIEDKDIKNHAPHVENGTHDIGGCTGTYQPGQTGLINITRASGHTDYDPDTKETYLTLSFDETNLYDPGFVVTCPPGVDPRITKPTQPTLFLTTGRYTIAEDRFLLIKQYQVQNQGFKTYDDMEITLTPQ